MGLCLGLARTGDADLPRLPRLGQKESTEYQEATQWLQHLVDELGLSPQRIFPVPGKHDLPGERCSPAARPTTWPGPPGSLRPA